MPTNEMLERVDQYCERLSKALAEAPAAERDEIVEDVRQHVLERIDAEGLVTADALDSILQAVGDPEDLAEEYRMQAMLRHAATSASPLVLLKTTMRWATKAAVGLIASIITLAGYGCAAVFYLSAFLKPLFPSRIGLWLAPQHGVTFGYWDGRLSHTELYGISLRPPASFVLGTLGPTDGPVTDLLGIWLVPVALVCGVFAMLATTLFARLLIRHFAPRRFPSPRHALVTASRSLG